MAEVVAHAAAALHQLHLLLIDAHDAAIRVGVAVKADDEAVRQRAYLVVVADAAHGAALGDNIAEVLEQAENLVLTHGVGIFLLDAGKLAGQTMVHVVGGEFKDIAERIFEGIFAYPYTCGELVAVKVL